eukprot:TRINITY_DN66736_c4_g3_i1.p1 TRINITY_DN66736_c4_g3~~TRINITY_DN66736_c4_g3_i1.p1  ORF type:complete len:621 (+),score=415.86 TRINITY_DN66736_c4_g3_i1:149-2011(+)
MSNIANFTEAELKEYREHFDHLDIDGNGTISEEELTTILTQLKMFQSNAQVKALIKEVDQNHSGTVDFHEFLVLLQKIKSGETDVGKGFAAVVHESKKLIKVKGASGLHSFAQEELSAFANHLNACLANDDDVKHLVPIDPNGLDLCDKVGDGILLAKFINLAVNDTIDVRAINRIKSNGAKLSLFQVNENQNLVISAAKSIGVKTVNLGATELIQGQKHPHLVLGLVWQLVRLQLLGAINLNNHPELYRLLEDGEELADLLRLPPEQLLLRWFNYHLAAANHPRRVNNFGGDVADSECYTVLLNQIAPATCDRSALDHNDLLKRAEQVLANAAKLGVSSFIKPSDIQKGNRRLNLAFTAAIFNQCPGLDPLNEEEMEKVGLDDEDSEGTREERAFRMWMNSLGVADLYINNLFEDCKDGLALLKVIDHVEPGIVAWNKVERKVNNKFKRVSNCNYVVVLGKQLRFSLVGIGGVDIVDGNKKLVLALVWQLMRYHTLKFLAEVQRKRFGDKPVTDAMIIQWANDQVKAKGRSTSMSSFKDPSLATSLFFMDLLYAVEPRIIDWDLVTAGETEEDRMLNARYAISVARKLGATIFLLPEDITEVKPKMILTLVASIMAVAP